MSDTTEMQQMTVIGPDTHIKGEMSFEHSARILGSFDGKIAAAGEVQIGEGAVCRASVEASRVVVDGTIEGNVTASERIELNHTARVTGDVVAATLVVAEGASFVGHCTVGPDALSAANPVEAVVSAPVERPIVEVKPIRRQPVGPKTSGQKTSGQVDLARAKLAEAQAKLARLEQNGIVGKVKEQAAA